MGRGKRVNRLRYHAVCSRHHTKNNSGSSYRWSRMIPSQGTNALTEALPGSGCIRAATLKSTSERPGLSADRQRHVNSKSVLF
jgi:hypothetical protein